MTPQLLIFDLDGTLIDSRADLATAVNLMRAHFHLPPLPLETVTTYIGNGVRMLVTRSLQDTGVDVETGLSVLRPFYEANVANQTTLYPGVREGLPRLRDAGHVLAIATNKPAPACRLILDHFRIASLFQSVLGGGSVPNLKPHPEMVETIQRGAGLTSRDTWVIGDNYTDLECARRAGAASIFLTYGYGTPGAETPTRTLDTFDALLPIFLSGSYYSGH